MVVALVRTILVPLRGGMVRVWAWTREVRERRRGERVRRCILFLGRWSCG